MLAHRIVIGLLCVYSQSYAYELEIGGWKIRVPSRDESLELEYTLFTGSNPWEDAKGTCKYWHAELLCYDSHELGNLVSLLPKLQSTTVWLGSECGREEKKCWTFDFNTMKTKDGMVCGDPQQFICRREVENPTETWCPSDEKWGIHWPSIPGGQEVRRPCPNSSLAMLNKDRPSGSASWFCKNGKWSPQSPNVENCVSANIDWKSFLNEIWEQNITLSSSNLVKLVYKSKFPGDIVRAIEGIRKILGRCRSLSVVEMANSFQVVGEDIVIAADVLINKKDSWMQLHEFKRLDQIDTLMSLIEETGFQMSKVINKTKLTLRRKNIILEVIQNETYSLTFPEFSCWNSSNGTVGQITIPPLITESSQRNKVVFTWFDNLVDILPNEAQTFRKRTLNSAVVGASIPEGAYLDFSDASVEVLLEHVVAEGRNPICVYWVPYWYNWNSDGCQVMETNETHTLCACDHLTNFAVLMDVSCATCNLRPSHKMALRVISVVGCCISVLFLFVTVVILCYFRTLRNVKNTIHKNLSFCLLIGNLTLLVGMDRTETKTGCAIAAGLIQYFFLSAFCWMLMEAIHIQLLLTKVFQPKHSYTKRYYCFGYGVPLLILIPTVTLRHEDYGTKEFCWLSPNNGTIYSFIGPVAVVLFYNVVTLVMALWISHTCGQKKLDEQLEAAKLWARRSAVLLPILGITWSLGFLYIEDSSVGWAYAFASLNSLQGLGIFVFHVALRPEVKVALSRWWSVRNITRKSHKEPLRSADSNSEQR